MISEIELRRLYQHEQERAMAITSMGDRSLSNTAYRTLQLLAFILEEDEHQWQQKIR